jgi:hypothetical protein
LILPKEQQRQFYDLHRDRLIKLTGYEDRDVVADDIERWKSERPKQRYRDPDDDIFRDPDVEGDQIDPLCRVMKLDLSDEQAAALERALTAIIDGDRYFLSPRIETLREIRNMIPTGAETRTAPGAEALRAAASRKEPPMAIKKPCCR